MVSKKPDYSKKFMLRINRTLYTMCRIKRLALVSIAVTMFFSCNSFDDDIQDFDIPTYFYEYVDVAHPFTFSEALSSNKWKEMDSDKRNSLFQIPKNKLKQMNEMDLAMTCVFFYPRRFDNMMSEHPMTVFDRTKEVNNGFEKLFNMPLAADALLSLLKNYEVLQTVGNAADIAGSSLSADFIARFQINYICCMLASKEFSEKMSESTRLSLQKEIDKVIKLEKANSSSLLDINILYAVRSRLLRLVTMDETRQIDGMIYNTTLYEEPNTYVMDLMDSIIQRESNR